MGASHDTTWLMGALTGPWGSDTRAGHAYALATQFLCNSAVYVDALSWYACDTNPTHLPSHIDVYDPLGNNIFTTTLIPHDGTIGWQDIFLASTLALQAGASYRISACFPASCPEGFIAFNRATPTPTGVTWGDPVALECAVDRCDRPDTGQNDYFRGLDVRFHTTAPTGGGGLTTADVDNELKTWLSATPETNQHQTDLPWGTKAAVDGLTAAYNDLAAGLGTATHGYYADLQTLIGNIKSVTDTLPTPVARLSSIVLDHYSADIAQILSQMDSVLAASQASQAGASFTQDVVAGRAGFPTGTPNTAWTMAAQTDFDTQLAWAQPADMYVVSITSVRPGQSSSTFGGLTWYYRLGSWCVLNGSLGSSRRFLEFASQACDDGGRRMPGLALRCAPGTIGTAQAWTLG